jgi:NAD-dependent SIR2 family protein deacetylase
MTCAECGEEVDDLVTVTVGRKKRPLCEDCAEDVRHEAEIASEAESAMQDMMEYKGR